MSLYGDLPYKNLKELLQCIPEDTNLGLTWYYMFRFISEYSLHDQEIDESIIEKLHETFKKQHHSGGSWGVVMQKIMCYLGGSFTEEEKNKLIRLNAKN